MERVEKLGEANYKTWVRVPPVKGKANAAVVRLLAKHFKVSKSSVEILSGFKGKKKAVRVGGKKD